MDRVHGHNTACSCVGSKTVAAISSDVPTGFEQAGMPWFTHRSEQLKHNCSIQYTSIRAPELGTWVAR